MRHFLAPSTGHMCVADMQERCHLRISLRCPWPIAPPVTGAHVLDLGCSPGAWLQVRASGMPRQ